MRISKKSQYGLRAMVYLARVSRARKEKLVCALKEISEKEDIPFDFLEKIISQLEKAGLVKAKKGVSGGYFLTKSPAKITVGEILNTLEKTITLVECLGCGRIKKCAAKNVWRKIQKVLNKTLNSITLADLVNK